MCKVAQTHVWRYNRHKLPKAESTRNAPIKQLYHDCSLCLTLALMEEKRFVPGRTALQSWHSCGQRKALLCPHPCSPHIWEARESLSWNHKAFLQSLPPTSSPTSEHLLSYDNVSVLHNVLASEKISCRPQFWFWVPYTDYWFVSFLHLW